MASIKNFEDLEIWQLARKLNQEISGILEVLDSKRSYELKNQLDRSAGSIMDNIAEGFERNGNREFIQFLAIAKGSLGEVRSQLYRVEDRKYIESEKLHLLQEECLSLANRIGKFITYLNKSEIRGSKFIRSENKISEINPK
jgi:four helix bundle protein